MLTIRKLNWSFVLFTALSLSIGWGIRGNFGHEFGAMIPGALAAMAAVLLAGRDDWWRRVHYFAMFGALGWSFGGSISYMQVIAYTHSGDSQSVLYGFACLFVIGFLWGALGGAGTALPACLERERLTEFFAPLSAVFGAWILQTLIEHWFFATNPQLRQESPLYWYDTDWLAALTAIVAVLGFALIRRRFDAASSLVMHMAVGWWAGFLLLVVTLGWRMTPPRGDNWAGCVGMVAGLWIWLRRHGLIHAGIVSLISGFVGGIGFAAATLLKLLEVKSGWQTNWHSILEQTYGFINGLGIAAAMHWLAANAPAIRREEPLIRRWTEAYAVSFVLLGITWLNLSKNPSTWIKAKVVSESLKGLPPQLWFNAAYFCLAIAMIGLLICHSRRPLRVLPSSWLGRGQLLYLVFLWWMIAGNFERALVSFTPERLVTEGVLHVNAVICTMVVLLGAPLSLQSQAARIDPSVALRRFVIAGTLGAVVTVGIAWASVRAAYGDQFAGHAGLHIRFGPNATATKQKPAPGQPHP